MLALMAMADPEGDVAAGSGKRDGDGGDQRDRESVAEGHDRHRLGEVRKADADTLVVADGTSCRHQIHDGAQRDAVHVARVLAAALDAAA